MTKFIFQSFRSSYRHRRAIKATRLNVFTLRKNEILHRGVKPIA